MGAMNKSVLARRRRDLEAYARVLPSLDLKRRQLAAVLAQERRDLAAAQAALQAALDEHAQRLPMLAAAPALLRELCRTGEADAAPGEAVPEEKLLGVALPALPRTAATHGAAALVATAGGPSLGGAGMPALGPLAPPPWLADAWRAWAGLRAQRAELALRMQRIARLEQAVKRTLQRVNLFEKVLIPQARVEIHAIRIALADAERAAIVRAKRARALLHREAAGGASP